MLTVKFFGTMLKIRKLLKCVIETHVASPAMILKELRILRVCFVGPTTLCLSCKPASQGEQQSGAPIAATRECARKRRAAAQDALR
jgi:hypothetical protein